MEAVAAVEAEAVAVAAPVAAGFDRPASRAFGSRSWPWKLPALPPLGRPPAVHKAAQLQLVRREHPPPRLLSGIQK